MTYLKKNLVLNLLSFPMTIFLFSLFQHLIQ